MKTALIDADVLRYEVGSIGQVTEVDEFGEKHTEMLPFDYVARVLDEKIENILDACWSPEYEDRPIPVLYLSGSTNYRDQIAVTKPYKGTRVSEKPLHFKNLTAYIKNQYKTVISDGCEADDMMAAEQFKNWLAHDEDLSVICTRDKDLRMIPGWHYGWECGAQREVHMHFIDENGYLLKSQEGKVTFGGMLGFYYQMLIGDSTDNIPGCPGIGPKKAFDILGDLSDEVYNIQPEGWKRVYDTYKDKGCTDEYILEQGQLLWMTQGFNEDGSPILWQLPD